MSRSSQSRKPQSAIRNHWPELLVALLPVVYFWPLVLGVRRLFWGLPLLQFVPWRTLVRDTLRAGHLPLWAPQLGMGAPLLANLQSAVFYPPNWLALVLPPDYVVGLLAVLHLSLAGVGMVRLARHLGLGPFAAAVAGLAFGFSDYLVGRLWFITINNAVAWLPWIVLAVDNILLPPDGQKEGGASRNGGTHRDVFPTLRPVGGASLHSAPYGVCAALIALQLFAGHAQTSFYTLLLVGAWALWRGGGADVWKRRVRVGLGVLFGLLIAAVQLLPTAELLAASARAEAAEYEFATTYSLWPWRLISFVAPTFFGHPVDGSFWAYPNYWEDTAYVGLLPLGLAVAAVGGGVLRPFGFAQGRIAYWVRKLDTEYAIRNTPLIIFLGLVALLSILLALGKFALVFPFFYRYVPGFGLFQAPARVLLWYVFAVSLLAGIGADRWRPGKRVRYWSRLGVAGCLLAAAVGALGLFLLRGPQQAVLFEGFGVARVTALAGMMGALGLAGILGVVGFWLALRQPEEQRQTWQAAVVAFVALDLALAARGLNPLVDPALYAEPTPNAAALSDLVREQRLYQFGDDEYHVRFERYFILHKFGGTDLRKWQAARAWLLPNLPALDDLNSANNFDPLLSDVYEMYIAAVEAAPPDGAANLLRTAGVGAVISSTDRSPWPLIYQNGAVRAYSVDGAARVRIVPQACTVSTAEAALAIVASSEFDPDAWAVLVAEATYVNVGYFPLRCSGVDFTSDGGAVGEAALRSSTNPNIVTIDVELEQDGLVVLADTDYPGWQATLDGAPVHHWRANGAFRAVAVPVGAHVVEFRYKPRSFLVGAWVSGIALLVLGVAAIAARHET